ncbi:hypothetical protein PFISCL1PPCAC_3988, partial [Pristionchus fissidentatus]
ASIPSASGLHGERGARTHGDEMNETDVEYLERPSEQGGFAEIRDHQGNTYMVSLDDLAAVGVDINRQLEISEEQMNTLLSMVTPMDDNLPAGHSGTLGKQEEYDEGGGSDQLTISILLDGSIKLVAAGGHESYFSPSQLAEINIDTQNLTDDDIKRIVQLVGAATGEAGYDDVVEKPEKRRKLEGTGPSSSSATIASTSTAERRERETTTRRMHSGMSGGNNRVFESIHNSSASTSSASVQQQPVQGMVRGVSGNRRLSIHNGLIGESVKIQNAKGKIVSAVVRYSRPGMGYKVQTADGKFEWIPPERIIDRAPRISDHRDYDHKSYTSEAPPPPPSMLTATLSTSTGGPLMLSRRVFPPLSSSSSAMQQSAARVGVGRHMSGGSNHHHATPLLQQPTNFCCPVCDRKVYQKEPAYIVIRLPACDACTREKILIVDDETTARGDTISCQQQQHPVRLVTRSIATDTDDLSTPRVEEKNEEIPSTTSPEEPDLENGKGATMERSVEEGEGGGTKEGRLAKEEEEEKIIPEIMLSTINAVKP